MDHFTPDWLCQLRYFMAAAQHGSIRKAAVELGVQQSAFSRRIRHLEDRLGASLFNRRSNGVRLTVAGRHFHEQMEAAMRNINDGARDVRLIGKSVEGRVRIGVFSSLASGFLGDLLRAYTVQHPDVRLDFVEGSPTDHVTGIRNQGIDIAFIAGATQHHSCISEQLWSEGVFVALPAFHELCNQGMVHWADLSGQSFIVSEQSLDQGVHDSVVKRLSELGQHIQIRRQCVGRDNLLSLVAVGIGLTLTSEATTAASFPGVVYRKIVGETLPFSAVWSPNNDNPALRRLLSIARDRCKIVKTPETQTVLPKSPPSGALCRTRDRSP